MRQRSQFAHGNSGVPIVGDPDHVARQLIELSRAGLNGIAVSLVNYADELPYLRAEVLPRLEQAGLRLPRDGRHSEESPDLTACRELPNKRGH